MITISNYYSLEYAYVHNQGKGRVLESIPISRRYGMQNELEYLLGIRSYMLEYHTNIMHEGTRAAAKICPRGEILITFWHPAGAVVAIKNIQKLQDHMCAGPAFLNLVFLAPNGGGLNTATEGKGHGTRRRFSRPRFPLLRSREASPRPPRQKRPLAQAQLVSTPPPPPPPNPEERAKPDGASACRPFSPTLPRAEERGPKAAAATAP